MSDLHTDVEILKKDMKDMKSIHRRLDNAIIKDTNFVVEGRRQEFNEDIKNIHSRITRNNEEIIAKMNEQALKRTEELNSLKNEMMIKVGTLEKWRWMIIGASIVIGFALHKMMNFQLLIN